MLVETQSIWSGVKELARWSTPISEKLDFLTSSYTFDEFLLFFISSLTCELLSKLVFNLLKFAPYLFKTKSLSACVFFRTSMTSNFDSSDNLSCLILLYSISSISNLLNLSTVKYATYNTRTVSVKQIATILRKSLFELGAFPM